MNGLINNLANFFRHHSLNCADIDTCFFVAQNIHRFGSLQHGQAHRRDFDAGTGNDLDIFAQLSDWLAESNAGAGSFYHQFECNFSLAD